MLSKIKSAIQSRIFDRFSALEGAVSNLMFENESLKLQLGALQAAQLRATNPGADAAAEDVEFKVFSQWGDDGIIQWLVHQVGIVPGRFVEFGVEDFSESNCRFLMMNNNWEGLVIDGDSGNIDKVQASPYFWKYSLRAVSSFVTAENITGLLSKEGFGRDVDLLSIDIDGNDYWVWEAIEDLRPAIVIIEYNSLFGADRAVTIPYDESFFRTDAHHSNLYFGASLKALELLGQKKGYGLVCCSSSGNNAFFVRTDLGEQFTYRTANDAYREARFREARDADGRLTFISASKAKEVIRGLPVTNVETGDLEKW